MASVRKLVLVPVEEFERLTQGREEELPWIRTPREVTVPVPAQQVSEAAEHPTLPSEAEDLPRHSPPPSPQGGKGGEGEGEEGQDTPTPPPGQERYIPHKRTGKRASLRKQKEEAGVWHPPGHPASTRRRWIHV